MKSLIPVSILILAIAVQVNAQYANVKLSNSNVMGEVWIAMNPKNPNNLSAGTIGPATQQSNMVYYYSFNGGYNWSGGTLYSTLAQPGSDPVVLTDTNGYFYYICVGNWHIPPPNADKLLCCRSTNGGANWDNGAVFGLPAPKMNDMPMGCVDLTSSQYGNSIYVTWTLIDSMSSLNPLDSSYVYFSRSTNLGQTFSTPKRISKIAGSANWSNSTPEGPVPCTGPNGEIYVTYPYNQQILFTRSLDGGNTWLNNEVTAANQTGGWLWHHSPVAACDVSNSQYRGNVYICYSSLTNVSYNRDIYLVRSTNRGDTWSTPLKVNNDATTLNQEMPWICVDAVTGYLWIVFYDGRNFPTGTYYDVYAARSTDGGTTFQNVKISNTPTLNSYSYVWLGDYINITARNNRVRAIWTNSTGYYYNNVWIAIIDTFTTGVHNVNTELPSSHSLGQNYPNPFNSNTVVRFSLSVDSKVSIKVYDVQGREVQTLVNERLQAGTYEAGFDGSMLTSGVYFYRLVVRHGGSSTDGFSETKRMVLLK